jgi:SAM-dependent methyltransferase
LELASALPDRGGSLRSLPLCCDSLAAQLGRWATPLSVNYMNPSAVASTLRLGVAALACVALVRQCRKPTWWPGRIFALLMNSSHRQLTNWGLSHVPLAKDSVMLDVGCGGGRTIHQLALLAPDGKVYGIDYSAASIAVARRSNAACINAGQVDILHGSVSSLPFAAEAFDAVTAVETHYYWPDLEADLREVHRVLRPTGRIAIIAESYRGKRYGAAEALAMRLLGGKILSVGAHRDALLAAGFNDATVFEDHHRGWLCVVGVKRSATAA